MKTITVNTADLTGAALDWAVAVAVDAKPSIHPMPEVFGFFVNSAPEWAQNVVDGFGGKFSPSSIWGLGGLLIESQGLNILLTGPTALPVPKPGIWMAGYGENMYSGQTPLIAACRAIVAAKLGETVDVPEVLL